MDLDWGADIEIQDITEDGLRFVVLRQRMAGWPQGGGKQLQDVSACKFQAVRTNLSPSVSLLEVWRRDQGRADI